MLTRAGISLIVEGPLDALDHSARLLNLAGKMGIDGNP
jgi:3-polyprenyl-4-hydroxybenzoate decarboxylase